MLNLQLATLAHSRLRRRARNRTGRLGQGRPRRHVRGACTQESSSKLKLSREDGGIEIEFEVDQNRNGVPWKVTLRRNGSLVASTTAEHPCAERLFLPPPHVSGAGTIVATATRAGERCTAHASL